MKWFAMYLPQFHEVQENNEWWGKGFTEWTHVNGAKPIYRGHRQPIKPLNDNYYDLMEKETVQWQTDLMKQYGVDGLVYYHYYFCGQKLLEKPAENLLKWKDIDQKFFFCWANHSWYQAINGEKKLLREQTYGGEKEWEEHFQYLLPFFRDDRYEKKENKPVFMIFAPNFPEKNEMLAYFNKRSEEEGFSGIYIIETLSNTCVAGNYEKFRANMSDISQGVYLRAPDVAKNIEYMKREKGVRKFIKKVLFKLARLGLLGWVEKYQGDDLYKTMTKLPYQEKDINHGIFFSWDNTPRHGVRGYVITPPEKDTFMRYVDSVKDDEYLFINAWNEWAEGMMLEPTTHDGYRYLEWIKEWNERNGRGAN